MRMQMSFGEHSAEWSKMREKIELQTCICKHQKIELPVKLESTGNSAPQIAAGMSL